MADFFGYNKTTKGPGDIASASAVIVKINNNKVNLAQQVSIEYNRSVTSNYELGSDTVYLTAGQSGGTCNIDRLIGETSAFVPYRANPCALVNITVAKGITSCAKDIGTITMQGVLTSVGSTISAGTFTVSDRANYTIGNLVI